MKKQTYLMMGLVLSFGLPAWSKVNTTEKVEQLKVNAENSQVNLDQYKSNLAVVNGNVAEMNKAIATIKAQKTELQKNSSNVDKNKIALQEVEKSLSAYRDDEKKKIQDEQKQIDELQAMIKKLDDNRKLREANITAYNGKLEELKKEKENWSTQRGSLAEINQALDAKEKEASSERQKWVEKQKSYQGEVDKWDKQASFSDRTYKQFRDIK